VQQHLVVEFSTEEEGELPKGEMVNKYLVVVLAVEGVVMLDTMLLEWLWQKKNKIHHLTFLHSMNSCDEQPLMMVVAWMVVVEIFECQDVQMAVELKGGLL